jgi:hypothetical protein
MKAVLTLWYLHHTPNDGQSASRAIACGLYLAVVCGALTFGITLQHYPRHIRVRIDGALRPLR